MAPTLFHENLSLKEKSDMIFLVPQKRDEKLEIVKDRGEAAQIKFLGAGRPRRPVAAGRNAFELFSIYAEIRFCYAKHSQNQFS